MTLLDFQEETGKARPKFLVVAMVIAAFAFVGTLRNTLAADIAINLNESVEFGQGVAMTTACDDEITLTPHATFDNTPGVESFMFTSLRVSGIDSSEGKCSGKTFTIRAYGEDGILDLFNYREVLFSDPPDIFRIQTITQ